MIRVDTAELVRQFGLSGRVAVVTGAGSGLGRRAAVVLARAGASIGLIGRRSEPLAEAAAEIRACGAQALELALDVSDQQAFDAALAEAEQRLGGLWVLVNNAGVGGRSSLLDIEARQFDRIFGINTRGAFFAAQAFARRLVAAGAGGRIVHVCSLSAERIPMNLGVYAASKAALEHLTRAMAYEWAPHGINVNAINPGYVETDMTRDSFRTEAGQAMIRDWPRRRLPTPDALDGAVLLLSSPANSFTTGATLSVHDGQAFTVR